MKSSRSRIILGIVALAVLMVVGGVLMAERQTQEAITDSTPMAVSPQAAPAKAPAPVASGPKVTAPQVKEVMDAMQVSGERPPMMPKELIAKVLEENKRLGLFMFYHKHVLLDEQGRNEYRKLLSDPEMMQAMADELMDPGRGEVQPEEQYRRLMQIDYFKAALAWKDNPRKEQLLGLTRDVILHQNIFGGQDTERRYMLAGGKMEMYQLLAEHGMRQALDLPSLARGTSMEQLVAWIAKEDLRRRAQEEQIRTEMQAQAAKAASP